MKYLWIAIVAVIIFAGAATFISYYNQGVRFESNIGKFDKESQNTLSNYTLKLKEKAKVPEMYVKELRNVIKDTFEGRYGADGSKGVFQFIQEKNLDLDSSMYKELQITIEAGRNDFKLSQSRKLDICTQYEILSTSFPANFIFGVVGKGYQNVEERCQIVLDADTNDVFKSKVASPINF
ncbi:MAG: hypothetical protein [Caudoviricetes sp.]|nr:MAG: hypothetical protein [Caudoviricetes sp.]